jgi:hypothetical protein
LALTAARSGMKRSPRTSTSRDAIVAALCDICRCEAVSSQGLDYLDCRCNSRHYNKALSKDSGVATCSGWWKLGEAVWKAVAEPCKLGRNDDATPTTQLASFPNHHIVYRLLVLAWLSFDSGYLILMMVVESILGSSIYCFETIIILAPCGVFAQLRNMKSCVRRESIHCNS